MSFFPNSLRLWYIKKSSKCLSFQIVFENKDKIILVMDCANGGELYDYINDRQQLTEKDARRIFRQIVSAIHYCHQVSFNLYVMPGFHAKPYLDTFPGGWLHSTMEYQIFSTSAQYQQCRTTLPNETIDFSFQSE